MAKISAGGESPGDLEEIREDDRRLDFYEFEDEAYAVSPPNVSENGYPEGVREKIDWLKERGQESGKQP